MTALDRVTHALDRWLTPRRVRVYASSLLAAAAVILLLTIALGRPPFDAFGRPIAADFLNKAIGARIAAGGRIAEIYDIELQRATQQALLGSKAGAEYDRMPPFLLPPFVAVVFQPFARLPYLHAAALWTICSITLLVASVAALRPLLPRVGRWPPAAILLVVFSTAPVIDLLGSGQDAALSLALLAGGLRLLAAGRDLAAGALLGLGLFKPQIFFLVPWLLLFERRGRALAGWIGVTAVLAAVSVALVGLDGLWTYRALLDSDLYRLGVVEDLRWKMQSLPALAGGLLPAAARPHTGGLAGDAIPAAAAVVVLFVLCRRRARFCGAGADIVLPYALAVFLAACASPHFFLYDCTVLILPALILLDAAPADGRTRVLLLAAYVLLWTAPLRQTLFGGFVWPFSTLAAPWAAVAVAALAWHTTRFLPAKAATADERG